MIVIRSGQHPHEVMFLVVFSLSGVAGLLAPERTTNSVLKELGPVGIYVFYGVLAVGALLAMAGVFSKGVKGPVIEVYGLGILTAELLGYGLAVFGFAGGRGLLSALFPIGMAIANAWRIRQVWREIRLARLGEALTERREEGQ